MKYTCPCCGYKTFDLKPPGTVDICPVCYWQDDLHQYFDPDFEGGANILSLRQSQEALKDKTDLINDNYAFDGPKDISKIRRMPLTEIARIFIALDVPLEKLLGLYLGFIVIKESSFVFNYEEIYELIGDDCELISRYIKIRERKDPNAILKEIHGLADNEADKEIKKIEEVFVKKLIEKLVTDANEGSPNKIPTKRGQNQG
ncbi:hypothetical protein C7R94_13535 [Brevibacillus sp. NRRL NRS-603]|nr:hypothetical protein C7R94_13535 [Brevibacillus sp. NRRL NRS-603]